jgi:hypothetical protein
MDKSLLLFLIFITFWTISCQDAKNKLAEVIVNKKYDSMRYYSLSKEESISGGRLISEYMPVLKGSNNINLVIKDCWTEINRLQHKKDNFHPSILIIEFEASKVVIGDKVELRYAFGEENSLGEQLVSTGQRFIDFVTSNNLGLMTTDTLTFKLKLDDQISTLLLIKQ